MGIFNLFFFLQFIEFVMYFLSIHIGSGKEKCWVQPLRTGMIEITEVFPVNFFFF